jgi:membrane protease YdiL (CAAX protease family)
VESAPLDIAPAAPTPPGTKSALGFFATVMMLYVVLGGPAQGRAQVLGLAWTEVFVFLLPAAAAAAASNLRPAHFLRLSGRPRPLWIGLGLAVGGTMFLAAGGIMSLTTWALPASWVEAFDLTRLFTGSRERRAALALVASLAAPFAEEVSFRGYVLSALGTRARPWPAILGSAALFGVMHLDPVRLPAVLFMGAVLGWLAWRSGSLWPAVAAHAANNGLGAAMVLRGAPDPGEAADPAGALSLLAFGLAAMAPMLLAFRRATPHPPSGGDPVVLRNPANPSIRFHLAALPPAYALAGLAGLALWLAVALGSAAAPAP